MSTIARPITIEGKVASEGDLSVSGSVRGEIWAEGFTVTIAAGALVDGDVVARQIIVHGRVHGSVLAREIVEIVPGAIVDGRVVTSRLILHDGGTLQGTVRPDRLEAAFTVASHRRTAAPGALDASAPARQPSSVNS